MSHKSCGARTHEYPLVLIATYNECLSDNYSTQLKHRAQFAARSIEPALLKSL